MCPFMNIKYNEINFIVCIIEETEEIHNCSNILIEGLEAFGFLFCIFLYYMNFSSELWKI
jgi:hypothetical protein